MYEVAELEQAIACPITMYQKIPSKDLRKEGNPTPSDVQYSILSFERKKASETVEKSKVTTRADECKDSSQVTYGGGWIDRSIDIDSRRERKEKRSEGTSAVSTDRLKTNKRGTPSLPPPPTPNPLVKYIHDSKF